MRYQDYILLSLLWTAYCAVHSGLISVTVTDFLKRAMESGYRFYRLLFNIFSLVTLVPLLMFSRSTRFASDPLFTWEGARMIQYFLVGLAAILVFSTARHYGMLQFLGTKQILQGRAGKAMTKSGELDSSGILGIMRHPWYLAVFILVWAHDFNLAGMIINLVRSAYLLIGTLLEERKLVIEFGDQYKLYQRQVSMFFPVKWLGSKFYR